MKSSFFKYDFAHNGKLVSALPERQRSLAQECIKKETTYDLIYKMCLQ